MVDLEGPIWWFGVISTGIISAQAILRLSGANVPAQASGVTVQPPRTAAEGTPRTGGRRLDVLATLQRGRFALLALVIALIFFVALDGFQRDFHVPLAFSSDSLMYEILVKGTMDHGWWWTNPSLSAPYTFHALSFPANSNVDHVIVWLVSRFSSNIGPCINFSWMIMLVAAGMCMELSAEALGLSTRSSWILGLLYAFAPYGLYRQIDHFGLAIYLIPLPAMAALQAATGRLPKGRLRWILIGGCGLIGLNYVYYAFFAIFFLLVAAAVAYVNSRSKALVSFVAMCISVVALCSALNLVPSFYVWASEGKPRIVRAKTAAESEVYGLKLRQLVSPVFEHSIPPFRNWTEKETAAQYPLETENMIDRLGLVATLGFLGILAAAILGWRAKTEEGALVATSGQLAVGGILLATVGGFGSLFALLVSPDIRAYNRITGFLAFFALVAVGVALDRFSQYARDRYSWSTAGITAGFLVAAFGIYDQVQALKGLNRVHGEVAADFASVEKYVNELEIKLPAGSSVYQLPFRTYLNDAGVARMKPYDHAKVYLVSHQLRWSYPALSNEQVDFQEKLMTLEMPDLLRSLKARGFRAVLIDRFGFADNAADAVRDCDRLLGHSSVLAADTRYVAYDLTSLSTREATEVTRGEPPPSLGLLPKPASAELAVCGGPPLYTIDETGNLKGPLAGRTPVVDLGAQLTLLGWAVDQTTRRVAGGVEVVVDGGKIFSTTYGAQRSDVASYFKLPAYGPSGFSASVPTKVLGVGSHRFALRILSPDRSCYREGPETVFTVK